MIFHGKLWSLDDRIVVQSFIWAMYERMGPREGALTSIRLPPLFEIESVNGDIGTAIISLFYAAVLATYVKSL